MSSDNTTTSTSAEEYAYYMPDWIWQEQSTPLMKSMLLFFDKVTLALPEALVDKTINRDPELAIPLAEKGLLVNIDPTSALKPRAARILAETLTELVTNGYRSYYESEVLTSSHYGDIGIGGKAVRRFERLLESRGLIKILESNEYSVYMEEEADGDFPRPHSWEFPRLVRLNPGIRLLVLTLFAQVFRAQLLERGIIIHPITDSSRMAAELDFVLRDLKWTRTFHRDPDRYIEDYELEDYGLRSSKWRHEQMFSDQLSTDLLDVGADLSTVPLDEVLDFRKENMAHYVAYAADLREFLMTQASLHPLEQRKAQHERSRQLQDQAAELRKISRSAFGVRSAALLLSLVGAAWTAKHGDVFGSILAGLSASAQAVPVPEPTVTSYSYILKSSRMR